MNKKKNLLKLFSQNTEYYFHLEPKSFGTIVYTSEEKDTYTIDGLEFKMNKIIEGFLNESEITFERVIPSVYFTNETNIEKLKYELTENFKENDNFSSFVDSIKEEYRASEVEDFLIYKEDPEAYEKRKEEEYKAQQVEVWERYKDQVKAQEETKRKAIAKYNNDLVKLFKENLEPTIVSEDKKFKFKTPFSKLVYAILPQDDEQANLWPKREDQFVMGNDKFEPIEIEGSKLSILLSDRMSESYIIHLELQGGNLNIIKVEDVEDEDEVKTIADYDFLMKVFNFDITPDYIDWVNMYENEKLDVVVNEIIRLHNEEIDKEEKEMNKILDSSKAKAFFIIDNYQIEIGTIPGIIGENIKDELFIPVENILNELNIDFKRGDWLNNNVEFIKTISKDNIEKIYNHLIEKGYMLDSYRQDGLYDFMKKGKPDTSQYKIYVFADFESFGPPNDAYDSGHDDFEFTLYTSHTPEVVYDQPVEWIDERLENLLKPLTGNDIYIDIGAAENYHSIRIINVSKKNLEQFVDDFLTKVKDIIDNSSNCEWNSKESEWNGKGNFINKSGINNFNGMNMNNSGRFVNLSPKDFYFSVYVPPANELDEMSPPSICLVPINLFHQTNCIDDSMGSHDLSRNVINALNRAGIYGDAELMESIWEVTDYKRTEHDIINSMKREGFIYNPNITN